MKHKEIILVIDSDEKSRTVLREILCNSYNLLEAVNGIAALKLIETHKESVAVILLETKLSDMEAVQFMEEMRRRDWGKEIPVVLITSNADGELSYINDKFILSEVVSKPFDPDIVRMRIKNVIKVCNYQKKLNKVIRKQNEESRRADSFFMEVLNTAVEFRECESGMHTQCIRKITKLFLHKISDKYPEYQNLRTDAELICDAAAIHDIGKLAVSDAILAKPGKLTEEEFTVMKNHTVNGTKILDKLQSIENKKLLEYCYDICCHHHERYDGSGYPDGLAGDEISMWAQIVAIADVYDALVGKRMYRSAYSHDFAIEMIKKGDCGAFNPILLECLEEMRGLLRQVYEGETVILEQVESMEYDFVHPESILKDERKKYQMLSESSGDIIFDYNVAADKILFSENFYQKFGKDIELKNASKVIADWDIFASESQEDVGAITEFLRYPRRDFRRQICMRTADGQYEWFEIYLQPLWNNVDNREVCKHIIGRLVDINDLKSEAVKWQQKALRDGLTGLYNNMGCRQKTEELLAEGHDLNSVCFYIDIDDFKEINDTYGHLIGDQLLKEVGRRIRECFRYTDIVARVGGDEFIIISSGLPQDLIPEKAEMLCEKFRQEFVFGTTKVSVTASVGIAVYSGNLVEYDKMLEKADKMLYKAKGMGKNRYLIGVG